VAWESNDHMTDDVSHVTRSLTPKGQTRDPNTFRAQYLENSYRCYLAAIANDGLL